MRFWDSNAEEWNRMQPWSIGKLPKKTKRQSVYIESIPYTKTSLLNSHKNEKPEKFNLNSKVLQSFLIAFTNSIMQWYFTT